MKNTKHLFFILSNINKLVVEAYLDENPHLKEHAIILYPKRFKPNTSYESYYFPYFDDKIEYERFGKNFLKKIKQCKEIHKFIESISNGKQFIFYASHFYINTFRVIISNKLCNGYYYIEEGTLSYSKLENIKKGMPDYELTFLQKIGFGFQSRNVFPDLKKMGICISKNAFPFLENKYILKESTIKYFMQEWLLDSTIKYDNSAIFVFDSSVENKILKIEEYIFAIIKSIAFIKKNGYKKVYYKFHPDQFLYQTINFFRIFLNEDAFEIEFQELESKINLEYVFMSSKNILVIHTMSSLGYYAIQNNHIVYSNASFLIENKLFKSQYFDLLNKDFNFELIPVNA